MPPLAFIVRHALADVGNVGILALDQNGVSARSERGNSRRAAAGKGIDQCAPRRRDERDEPFHQLDRLHGWMAAAPTILRAGFCREKEAGCGAAVAARFSRRSNAEIAIDID